MLIKSLLFAISRLTMRNPRNVSELEHQASIFLKRTIRAEILAISYKILIGVVLAATVIFSIIQLGKAYQVYLSFYENGTVIEIASFAFVAVFGSALLYYLLASSKRKAPVESVDHSGEISVKTGLQSAAAKFAEGFFKGLETRNPERNPINTH